MNGPTVSGAAWSALLPPGQYIAVPSRRRALIVASRDPAVLRYLADSILSVPPGTGPVLSLLLTIGLRSFRYVGVALLAAIPRTRVMLVTRAG